MLFRADGGNAPPLVHSSRAWPGLTASKHKLVLPKAGWRNACSQITVEIYEACELCVITHFEMRCLM